MFYYLFLVIMFSSNAWSTAYEPNLPDHGVMSLDYDGFLDPARDYSINYGRVSDVLTDKKVLKIKVENDTTRFLKPGDQAYISIEKLSKGACDTSVIATELSYLTVQLTSWEPCWSDKSYFRRGLVVKIQSSLMQLRVQQASAYRKQLLERRQAYLKQLSDVNNFFWKYDTDREKLLNEFDQRLNALKNEKLKAVGSLDDQRASSTKVQGELMQELNSLDELLKFYRIDRRDILTDRFHSDYDTSAPVDQRARVQQ